MKKPPLFSADFEADNLPFGPSKGYVQLLDVANSIRAFGGIVWSVDKQHDNTGTLFRANIGPRQFRVLTPMYGHPQPNAPTEKGTPCHVVTTLPDLTNWLQTLAVSQPT